MDINNIVLNEESFQPLKERKIHHNEGKSRGRFYNLQVTLKRNRIAQVCIVFLIVITIMALMAPLSPYDPDAMDIANKYAKPSAEHFLGTDGFGRDYFTRALYGGRVSLAIGFFSMIVSVVIGTIYGTICGYVGGIVDNILMRVLDMLVSIPSFLIIVMLNAVVTPTVGTIILIIGFFSWMEVARIVRAQAMTLKSRDYVLASKGLGASGIWIATKRIIANASPQIIVAATLSIAHAILVESTLSFLGFGVQLPTASWGSMLQDAQKLIMSKPMLAVYPGALILVTVLCFNVLGDILRTALDPKQAVK